MRSSIGLAAPTSTVTRPALSDQPDQGETRARLRASASDPSELGLAGVSGEAWRNPHMVGVDGRELMPRDV